MAAGAVSHCLQTETRHLGRRGRSVAAVRRSVRSQLYVAIVACGLWRALPAAWACMSQQVPTGAGPLFMQHGLIHAAQPAIDGAARVLLLHLKSWNIGAYMALNRIGVSRALQNFACAAQALACRPQ